MSVTKAPAGNNPAVPIEVDPGVCVPEGWSFRFLSIGPELASQMLSVPRRNRPIRRSAVEQYVDDIVNGRWRLTPETILVGPEGEVVDGQHRLSAIVQSGVTLPFLVVFNIGTDLLRVVDTGRSRSTANVIGLLTDVKQETGLTRAARLLHLYLNVSYDVVWAGRNLKVLSASALEDFILSIPAEPSDDEVGTPAPGYEHLAHCVKLATDVGRRVPMPPTPMAVGMYLTSMEIPLSRQEDWIASLATGADLTSDSPVLALRERMRNRKPSMPVRDVLALYLSAWAAWRDGKAVVRLLVPHNMPCVGMPPFGRTMGPPPRRVDSLGADGARIRRWAEENGYPLPSRGRLPQWVKDLWELEVAQQEQQGTHEATG